MMDFEDDEILQGFVEESLEHLSSIENDLLAIEEGGAAIDEELVNKVFRAAHSIKGGAGFMGLTAIQELSHATENILGMVRNKSIIPTPEIINVLLIAADQLQTMIEDVANSNEANIASHVSALNAIADKSKEKQAEPAPVAVAVKTETPKAEIAEDAFVLFTDPVPAESTETPPLEQEIIAETVETEVAVPETAVEVLPTTPQKTVSQVSADKEVKNEGKKTTAQSDTTLRVHVSLLDSLMTLAGELVLSRNQLLQTISTPELHNVDTVGQRIDLITSELQEAIMLTRMQPIGNVFGKFPRVVRDLSKQLGKTIDLNIIGKDVELDKTIIEAINDPLTHLVRNSVDHGIELPAERLKRGKSEKGQITLKAFHEAGQVCIEISDDGKGLDEEALAASAVNKGLITAEQAQLMSSKEKINLIFMPGFSTAAKVTDVSGRGVGMDVVKTNLDQLGGNVELLSDLGLGTVISIKLPLTLAIIPCQIITLSNERYAIPQVNLEELLRIPASQVVERIERVGDAEVVRLRGNLLPLIRLADVIGLGQQDKEQSSALGSTTGDNALNIVVVSTGSMKYGLIVDSLQDSEEIVIKPLGRHLQQCKAYAGATIMGDGRIALILDLGNIAKMATLNSLEGSQRAAELAQIAADENQTQKDRQSLLIFHNAEKEQFAVPLNQVERIEKIKRADIEDVGNHRTMQYRGGNLPLIRVDDVAVVNPLADHDDLLVIVFNVAQTTVGLLAVGPVDAIEVFVDIDDKTLKQPGIMGSSIINNNTTLLVNIFELVQNVFPEWYHENDTPLIESEEEIAPPTILIAEDSNFFRNQLRSYMLEAGYHVIESEDGVEALQQLEDHFDDISLLVTDIEMPNMDGFILTEKIRAHQRFSQLPIIALTTLASEENRDRGKAVGIDEYHIKLDKERLMAAVHGIIKRMF